MQSLTRIVYFVWWRTQKWNIFNLLIKGDTEKQKILTTEKFEAETFCNVAWNMTQSDQLVLKIVCFHYNSLMNWWAVSAPYVTLIQLLDN